MTAQEQTLGDDTSAGPIIILEGIDKSGKSTLAMSLAQRFVDAGFSMRVTAFGVPEPGKDPYLEYFELAYESMWHKFGTIVDRMHWSELAYGKVFRPGTRDQQYERLAKTRAVDTVLGMAGATVIHCTRPVDEATLALDATDRADHGNVQFDLDQVNDLAQIFRHQAASASRRNNGLRVIDHEFAAPIMDDELIKMVEPRLRFAKMEGPLR